MSGLRLLGRRLSKQAELRLKLEGGESWSPVTCLVQTARGFATGENSGSQDSTTKGLLKRLLTTTRNQVVYLTGFPAGAGRKPRKNWRALADEQLRPSPAAGEELLVLEAWSARGCSLALETFLVIQSKHRRAHKQTRALHQQRYISDPS